MLGEPAVEHAIEPVRLLQVALFRVGSLALVVFHEVMDLAEHRPRAAHLPHQPFDAAVAPLALGREQLAGLVGEIDENCARLHQRLTTVVIDDRGDAIVRRDFQKLRFELFVFSDVDRMRRVGEPKLLERDGDLAAVGSRPGVEVDHGRFPCWRAWCAAGTFRSWVNCDQITKNPRSGFPRIRTAEKISALFDRFWGGGDYKQYASLATS